MDNWGGESVVGLIVSQREAAVNDLCRSEDMLLEEVIGENSMAMYAKWV